MFLPEFFGFRPVTQTWQVDRLASEVVRAVVEELDAAALDEAVAPLINSRKEVRSMQSALDRRQAILELLSDRRQTTLDSLALEFGVSKMTIRRDIETLSCSAPIYTLQGNGGGIRVADGYYIGRRYLRSDQEALLQELLGDLPPDKQKTMQSILTSFVKPQIKETRNR